MADRDPLDQMLDAALSTYADPGPNLAPRILAQVSAHSAARSRRHRWPWAASLATAAACLLLFVAVPRHTPFPHTEPRQHAAVKPLPPLPTNSAPVVETRPVRATAARPHRAAARALAVSAALPKLDIFPSPSPLSAEERALARVVEQSPANQRHDLFAAQPPLDEPIRISSISIPPISIPPPAEGKE